MKDILLLLFVAISQATHIAEWEMFKRTNGKTYQNAAEEQQRREIFLRNILMINQHNENYRKGLTTFHLKMNHFGDMSREEIVATMGRNISRQQLTTGTEFVRNNAYLPDLIDWRLQGAVTPVKDQAKCGSCWAFSATGALEGQAYIKTGKLVPLSEQNLIDCSGSYGNEGCEGGLPEKAFQYVKDNGGIDSEDSYPYEGQDGSCKFRSSKISAVDKGFVNVPAGDEDALKEAVATIGPISAGVDASLSAFHFYSGGIFYAPECSKMRLDHAILVVGYGSENGQDFWLVKNSWNTKWGEGGYIRMARNKGNNCGIATSATYPLV